MACRAVPGASDSHERRKHAAGLAGMTGTAAACTAGPEACCQGNWWFGWHRNTDLKYWEPFNYQASPSISAALLLRLFCSIYPQSHSSLMEECCDAVGCTVVSPPARPSQAQLPPTLPPCQPGKPEKAKQSFAPQVSAASLNKEISLACGFQHLEVLS